ncbi:hypothetical protein Tco_0988309 [Tanacetum coccineum]|uniref:Uncharacterized protein n=1 Tax=Tanacetum coccineum TaxID=301880 RepID=A0ABQ5EQR7_9ASTR
MKGVGVIKELVPRMFALELNKNATVSSKLNASSLDNSFRRKARSGIEEMQLNSLAEISRMTYSRPLAKLVSLGRLEVMGVFTVASFERRLMGIGFRMLVCRLGFKFKLKGDGLEGVYYGLWWYMWNFRNKLLFDKKISEKALIFDNLVSSSFYWCKFRCKASFKWDD